MVTSTADTQGSCPTYCLACAVYCLHQLCIPHTFFVLEDLEDLLQVHRRVVFVLREAVGIEA